MDIKSPNIIYISQVRLYMYLIMAWDKCQYVLWFCNIIRQCRNSGKICFNIAFDEEPEIH